MNFLPIAASDMDMIIGIIAVIGWIVAQVMGKIKGGARNGPPPDETTAPTDPQDELRKFFEEMEKTLKPKEAPAPAPPPVPPPLPVPRRPQPKPQPVAPPVRAQTVQRTLQEETPVESAEEAARVFMRRATRVVERAAMVPVAPVVEPSSLIPAGIRDPQALRKMIVTMEVLGKPIALRSA